MIMGHSHERKEVFISRPWFSPRGKHTNILSFLHICTGERLHICTPNVLNRWLLSRSLEMGKFTQGRDFLPIWLIQFNGSHVRFSCLVYLSGFSFLPLNIPFFCLSHGGIVKEATHQIILMQIGAY